MASHSMPNGRSLGETKSPTVALARQSSIRKSSAGDLGSSALPSLGTAGRLVDYEALIRHFDCPVCHDWVTPPIVQCRKGHIVCGPCKSKGLKACPVCKQRFSDVTNWMMEQVSLVIAFPCKFQGNGCRIYSELIHKTAHEALCSFRPVSCQYGIRGCTQILLYHLMEKHVLECRFKPPNLHSQLSSSSHGSSNN
ncbi:hypothetical protein GHT06_011656 [Daphnia sinensis]|uniref:RING-type E3 ubiquitin transferase n=1 Tax=Daphnia sinensis TaxID=1820382 RepID=A0AAD5KU95_9CRUS|nr:hypothetical protein GHT06_011656 [Daphnia sinensis]